MGSPGEGKASLMKRGELAEITTSKSSSLVPLCPGRQANKDQIRYSISVLQTKTTSKVDNQAENVHSNFACHFGIYSTAISVSALILLMQNKVWLPSQPISHFDATNTDRFVRYCMRCKEDYFVLHVEPLHRRELQAPPLCSHVPTCQSAVIAILEEQHQAAEL